MKPLKEQLANMFGYLNGEESYSDRDRKTVELIQQVYGGKQVLFIVPRTMGWAENQHALPADVTAWLYPERDLTLAEQRLWVESTLFEAEGSRHCVVTTSATILTDAFSLQIWSQKENGAYKPCGVDTFGASPCRVALHTMDIPEVIGSLSDRRLNDWLGRDDWTKAELEVVAANIGGGWPRARLTEMLENV